MHTGISFFVRFMANISFASRYLATAIKNAKVKPDVFVTISGVGKLKEEFKI